MANFDLRNKPKKKLPNKRKQNNKQDNNWLIWVGVSFIILMLISQTSSLTQTNMIKELSYSQFYSVLQDNSSGNKIEKIVLTEQSTENTVEGNFSDGTQFKLNIPQNDEKLLDLMRSNVKDFSVVPPGFSWASVLLNFLPIIIIIGFIWFLSHRGNQMGNKLWSFGKSKAKTNSKHDKKITFKDVAGVDEEKDELQEVIEFLKDPKKFTRLGGKIPKGVLLVGPPGTGKTLLAKAVAGEAEVPFFSLSGSDFVEMFVGVGASRVRDLFEPSRKASQVSGKGAIIFIDEIDAVGRQRFAGIGGGNDEREQTLNALLVEMDGFNTQTGLIVIAATNRPDTLDPALLRPGRFDRQITVGLPDINGREGILKVHSKTITLSKDADLKAIARQTVYFSGADLANVCNEAALLAARKNKETVEQEDLLAAVERVTMGPEKKSRVISKLEKETTACHEAGHALLSLLIDEVDTFTKVSIIPRGMAGGYTLTPPKEDKHYHNKKELKGLMAVMLGGMVAEKICLNDTSTGVQNDLQRVTQVARQMVCGFGMSEKLGPIVMGSSGNQQRFLGRDLFEEKNYSEHTAKTIDEEIKAFVNEAYDRAKKIIEGNMDKLEILKNKLIEKENLDIEEAKVLLGMKPAEPEETDKKEENSEVAEAAQENTA